MLSQGDKPLRRVSQAPIKFTICHAGCGATVKYRTNPKVSCEACKIERKRQSSREAMTRQRRKKGISAVKGETRQCAVCSQAFEARQHKSRYCPTCAVEVPRQRARDVSRKKTADGSGAAYAKAYYDRKQKSDPRYSVNRSMRVLIGRVLSGKKAGASWTSLVPYSLSELMLHLERQFLPGMSWNNRSEWHVDHIVPLSSFAFSSAEEPAFQQAWALTNLRPLWSGENMRKSARRTHLL